MKSPFVGNWKCVDEDSSVRIHVEQLCDGTVVVRAHDTYDDEKLDVVHIALSGNALSFECHVPSTGYVTRNKMVLADDGTVRHEITMFEEWVKEGDDGGSNSATSASAES